MPDWIELEGPEDTGKGGLAWDFTIRTDQPGEFLTQIVFECDTGKGFCQISLEIKDGAEAEGDLIWCDSPFDLDTTDESLESLVRILNPLPLRIHCLDSLQLSHLAGLHPKTIVLHWFRLLELESKDRELLSSLVRGGVNLVVLAGQDFHGTTPAANKVLAPFGLRLMQDGTEESGITREERRRRSVDWHERFDRADSGPDEIAMHPLTNGVKRVEWIHPCPVLCTGESAIPLVKNPADHKECFVAVSQANGYVAVVGMAFWRDLSSVGWPYDNDRLFANLLLGRDAESIVA